MASFILRRLLVSVLIIIAASFLMYMLVAYSADPLQDLRSSNSPNKQALINARIQLLDLDVVPPLRWLLWLGGAAKCLIPFANACDLGSTVSNAKVVDILPQALGSTVQLVTVALILAVLLGVTIGIVTALRQYSGLDNVVTFLSFFLYSLPAFLVAVLLKEFVAIGFNNFLVHPMIPWWVAVIIGIVAAFIWQSLIGGDRRRRLLTFGISGVATAAVLLLMSAFNWFLEPGLGPVVMILLVAAVVIGTTALISGLQSRRGLIAAAISGAVSLVCYFALQGLFNVSTPATIVILAVVAIVVSIAIGWFVGGYDRGQNVRIAVIVTIVSGALILVDRFMRAWPQYLQDTNGRPIATVGSSTPGLTGDMWETGLDTFTHFLLPTIALLLISFASYTRYSRAGMLEVLNQDFIRTARAKGLPERTVIVRHAFRNMLIPITTLVAFDVGALLGGAIITERVFAIPGMGSIFALGLSRGDLNPVMAYFLVIAAMAILFNFLADLAYAALDPRVRVR